MTIDRIQTLKEADRLRAEGKLDLAIVEYLKVLAIEPKNLGLVNKVGDLYIEVGRVSAGVACFCRIASVYEKDGFLPQAIAITRKAIRNAPMNRRIWHRMIQYHADCGDLKEALSLHLQLAGILRKGFLFKEANEEWEAAFKLAPLTPYGPI